MILNIILILSIFANKQVLHVWFMYLCPTVQLDMGVEEARLGRCTVHWHCTGWCTANVYTVCRKGADTNSCVWTAEERGRVMDQLMLWDFVLEERLGEMEAWSVLCQGCYLLSEKLNTIEDTTDQEVTTEDSTVTTGRTDGRCVAVGAWAGENLSCRSYFCRVGSISCAKWCPKWYAKW